jgi:hypothetical protein
MIYPLVCKIVELSEDVMESSEITDAVVGGGIGNSAISGMC